MTAKRGSGFDNPLCSSTPKRFCTQESVRSLSQPASSDEGTAGVVKCINVKNFMCHDHFEMGFNSRINFISGRNGSGKSAIQTALILGLGGDTRATSRGTTVSSFIKEGKNQATIHITLTNRGFKSYKPELYGNELTIIRTLSKTSSFKIKAENGKTYSVKKAEIKALAHRFQIQATNPVAILNQNTARTFLNSSDPKQKYKLFMEATLFEDILAKKQETSNDLKLMKSILDEKMRALSKLEVELNKDREKLVLIEKCRQAFEKKSELQNELLWSRVVESEKTQEDLLKKRKDLEAQVEDIKRKIGQKESREKEFHDKIADMTAAIQAELNTLKKYQDQYDEVSQSKRRKMRELEDKKLKESSIKKKIASKEKDNRHMQAEMNDYERKKTEHEEKKQEAKRRRQEAEAKRGDIVAAKRTLMQDLANAENAVEQAAIGVARQKNKWKGLNRALDLKEEQKRNTANKQGSNLAKYGPHMEALVNAVKDAHRRGKFSEMPRGPLGAYIKCKDQDVAALTEFALGYGTLNKFVVNSREDERELKAICDRLPSARRVAITCAKFIKKPFSNIQEADYNNVFANLEIEDPVVSNIIIELTSCQKVILIEDNQTALNLLSKQHNVPANTKHGFTPDGSKHFPTTARQTYKTYSGNLQSKVPRFLQADQKMLIRELNREIANIQSELSAVQGEIRESEAELTAAQQHQRDVDYQLKSLSSKLKKLEDDMNRSVLEDEGLASLDLYKEEFNNNRRDIEKFQAELEQIEADSVTVKTELETFEIRLAELTPRLESDEVSKMAEVEEMKNSLIRFRTETGTWQGKLKEAKAKVEHLNKRVEDQETSVQLHVKEAEELSSRDNYLEPRPLPQVEEELLEVQGLLERAQEMGGGDPMEIEAALHERLESFEKSKLECDIANRTAVVIEKCMEKRNKAYKFLLERIIEAARTDFTSILASRGFSGDFSLDHLEKRLDILIQTRQSQIAKAKNSSSQPKDTASLSGGEKSYTTVAFIMALWRGMAVPFFSMDEFDVFMDSINRKTIIDLLVNNALEIPMQSRQFLFLTPLDCSILDSKPYLTIHKMSDPQRNGVTAH